MTADALTRREELAHNLAAVRSRLEAACARAGRDAGTVTTVVVTKTFPASDVELLASLGVRDVGESRDQEARAKVADLSAPAAAALSWHFVGRLQTNKTASVAAYADVVHSVDRERLVTPLSRGARAVDRILGCLVQVSLDGDPDRGGALPENVHALAEAVARAPGLELRGLMAVAPLGEDPGTSFERLARLSERLRQDHPGATWLSAGMSGDLEQAVEHGATHLRVGGAVLGSRPPLG